MTEAMNDPDYVMKLIRRFAEIELSYVQDKKTKLIEDLVLMITSMYSQVLRFLAMILHDVKSIQNSMQKASSNKAVR